MTDPNSDKALAEALRAMARGAVPELLVEAFEDARDEVRSILRRQLVRAMLDEATDRAGGPALLRRAAAADSARTASVHEFDLRTALGVEPHPMSSMETPTPPGPAGGRHAPSRRRGRNVSEAGAHGDEGGEAATFHKGAYVYGFTSAATARALGLPGADRTGTYAVVEGGLAAIVSDLSGERHGWGISDDGEPDLALLAPHLQEHERVLEEIIKEGPVLPMRFGTLYASEEAVRDVLRAHAAAMGVVLDRLDGKAEWGLTVCWDRERPRDEEGHGETAGAPAQEALASPGRSYLSRREEEREWAERVAERGSRVSAELHRAVQAVAADSTVHPARRNDGSGQATLLRASYLVENADRERFEAVIVEALESGADLGLTGELTGPWPPYNFSSIELEGASR